MNNIFKISTSITDYAAARIVQRGVCQDALALLTLHGIDVPAGGGNPQ